MKAFSGLCKTYLTCQIKRNGNYFYVEKQKPQNFCSIYSSGWNICANYDLQSLITPYADRKANWWVSDYNSFLQSITHTNTANAVSEYLSLNLHPQRAKPFCRRHDTEFGDAEKCDSVPPSCDITHQSKLIHLNSKSFWFLIHSEARRSCY